MRATVLQGTYFTGLSHSAFKQGKQPLLTDKSNNTDVETSPFPPSKEIKWLKKGCWPSLEQEGTYLHATDFCFWSHGRQLPVPHTIPFFLSSWEVWIQRFIGYGADWMTIKSTHQSKLRHPSLFAYLRAGCKIPPREICGTPPIPVTTTTRVATPDTHMGLGDVMQNLKQICSPTEK